MLNTLPKIEKKWHPQKMAPYKNEKLCVKKPMAYLPWAGLSDF